MLPTRSQVVGTDESVMHAGVNGNVTEPVVVVLSAYDPSALAVHVPVVCRDPVTGTLAQPTPTNDTSMLPVRLRHDDVTFQVPTTTPSQADTFEQAAGWLLPPLPALPPFPFAPPPEPPFEVSEPEQPRSSKLKKHGPTSQNLRGCESLIRKLRSLSP
jgi:hypothetical protein